MNNTAQKGNIITALLIGVVFVGLISLSIWYFYSSSKNQILSSPKIEVRSEIPISTAIPQTNTTSESLNNTYHSDIFDLSFKIPEGFKIKEQFSTIEISNNDQKIEINTIGTNFNNIDEYFNDTTTRGKITYLANENLLFNSTKVIKTRRLIGTKEELTYWLYHDYGMYFVTTSDKNLTPLIEDVARSIKFD